jgi:hypothetical protein
LALLLVLVLLTLTIFLAKDDFFIAVCAGRQALDR